MTVGTGDERARPPTTPVSQSPGWAVAAIVVVIIAGLIGLMLASPLLEDRLAGPGLAVTVSDVVAHPNVYYGQVVTVSGEVSHVLGERAFTIGGDGFLDRAELLIVSAGPIPARPGRPRPAPLRPQDLVQVTGLVRTFDLAAIEATIGADLDDGALRPYSGRPAVVASTLQLMPRAMVGAAAAPASLTAVADDPSPYLGKSISVSGAITRTFGERAFVLGDRLLVVSGQRAPSLALTRGTIVQVTGELHPLDLAAIEREIGADLEDALADAFQGKPPLVARSINRVT